MPNTTNGWPYPADTATPDVPRDIKALADRLDAVAPMAMAAGVAAVPANATNPQSTVAVTFPVGRFTVAPIVVVSLVGSTGGTQRYVTRVHAGPTASGFTAGVWTSETTNNITNASNVAWQAVQMDAASAAG
jgi:hypothetical protein